MDQPRSLNQLLEAAATASGLDRIDYRDPIAAFGSEAIVRLEPWLAGPELGNFALRAIERAAHAGPEERQVAVEVLRRRVAAIRSAPLQRDVQAAITRLRAGQRPAVEVVATSTGATVAGKPRADGDYIPPLSAGEASLLRLLGESLSPGWTIFVRPHLDGDRPALALLHPAHGGMLWDVHEGNLVGVSGAPHAYVDTDGTPYLDPLERISAIRRRLYADYLPGMGEAIDTREAHFGAVQVGVYFPNATNTQLRGLGMFERSEIVVTAEGLRARQLQDLVPNAVWATTFDDAWHSALYRRFSEYHPPTMSRISLTKVQAERVQDPMEPVWRGIQGVAGSGKSTVMARRATRLASLERRVLLVTYNLTLANYCRALVEDAPDGYLQERLVVQHFHGLCHVIVRRLGGPAPLHPDGRDEAAEGPTRDPDAMAARISHHFEHDWPECVLDVLSRRRLPPDLIFDEILVDEAQDFSPAFMEVLEKVRAPGGEVVLAFDRAQRLYGREDGIAGRLGNRVRKLDKTHRLRQRHADIATSLGTARGMATDPIALEDDALTLFSDEDATWAAVPTTASALATVVEVLERWQTGDGFRADATVVLVPSGKLGRAVVDLLAQRDISTNHIFEFEKHDRLGRRSKLSFVPHDQRIKVATIHSYKGWEADDVIVVEPPAGGDRSAAALYVALTRPRARLMVIASSDAYGIRRLFEPYQIEPDEALVRQAQRALARPVVLA